MVDSLVVWGAAGHALNVIDILRLSQQFRIVGLLDDVNPERAGDVFDGLPILGGREQLTRLKADSVDHMILAFGNNAARLAVAELVMARGFSLVTAVHPNATVAASATVGAGTVVEAGAVIDPLARVAANVIVNKLVSLGHESVVRDGASLGPGVLVGGETRICRGAKIGIGATLRDRITIGAGSVIGAGAVVLKDVPAGVVAYGVPATVMDELNHHG